MRLRFWSSFGVAGYALQQETSSGQSVDDHDPSASTSTQTRGEDMGIRWSCCVGRSLLFVMIAGLFCHSVEAQEPTDFEESLDPPYALQMITWSYSGGPGPELIVYANGTIVGQFPAVDLAAVIDVRGWVFDLYDFSVYYDDRAGGAPSLIFEFPYDTDSTPPLFAVTVPHAPILGHDFPNDEFFPTQWNLHNVGQSGSPADVDIDLAQAWTIETGSPDVIVATIEAPIEWKHIELRNRMTPGINLTEFASGYNTFFDTFYDSTNPASWNSAVQTSMFLMSTTIPDIVDVGGFNPFMPDPAASWNPSAYDPAELGDPSASPPVPQTYFPITANEPHYHTTQVASIVAGQRNNEYGLAGVAGGTNDSDGVRIMPIVIRSMEGNQHPAINDPDGNVILTQPAFVTSGAAAHLRALDHLTSGLEYVAYMRRHLGANIRVVTVQLDVTYPTQAQLDDPTVLGNGPWVEGGPLAPPVGEPPFTLGDLYAYLVTRFQNAVQACDDEDMLIVWAAGNNDGCDTSSSVLAPLIEPEILVVGNLTRVAALSPSSSCGSTDLTEPQIDLAAPGSQIVAATIEMEGDPAFESRADDELTSDILTHIDGTSYAAPHVAGVAALMFSLDPSLTAADARDILRETTDVVADPMLYGAGRLNAYRALLRVNRQPSLPGDVNADGIVDGFDASMIRNFLNGVGPASTPPCLMDVNYDDIVDAQDWRDLRSFASSGFPEPLVSQRCFCPCP